MVALRSTVTLAGAVTLHEDFEVADNLDGSLSLTAQASFSSMDNARVEDRFYDLQGLDGRLIPVEFADKAFLDGYYRVTSADLSHVSFPGLVGPRRVVLTAQLQLERVGPENLVDIESRLSGALTRTNSHGLTGERWHMPPPGHYGYQTIGVAPSTLSMTGAEGPVTLYRLGTTQAAVGVHPRWGCAVADYPRYRVRLIGAGGLERTGLKMPVPDGWEVHNSLVRVRADAAGVKIAAHDGSQWEEKTYTITVGSVLGAPSAVSVVRNTFEAVTVRLLWTRTPGRVQADLTLRRGARFVEGYIQTQPAASIVVAQAAAEGTTAATGYITATSNDAAGNRYMIGSAGAFTANTGARSITKSSATAMDFMAGSVVGGGSAPTGDQAANLMQRYLGSVAESVQGVRR